MCRGSGFRSQVRWPDVAVGRSLIHGTARRYSLAAAVLSAVPDLARQADLVVSRWRDGRCLPRNRGQNLEHRLAPARPPSAFHANGRKAGQRKAPCRNRTRQHRRADRPEPGLLGAISHVTKSVRERTDSAIRLRGRRSSATDTLRVDPGLESTARVAVRAAPLSRTRRWRAVRTSRGMAAGTCMSMKSFRPSVSPAGAGLPGAAGRGTGWPRQTSASGPDVLSSEEPESRRRDVGVQGRPGLGV